MKRNDVGVVGLGQIGGALAANLMRSGRQVIVRDPRSDAVSPVEALGAAVATTPEEVARSSPVVLTSLPHPDISREVYLGSDGLLAGARPDAVLIECSTVPVATSRLLADACAERGVRYLEAAVLGGVAAARSGEVLLFVGGDADVLADVREVLGVVAKDVVHAGPVGSAMTAKIVNNAVSHANMAVLCEAVAVGAKAGVSSDLLLRILRAGTGNSYQVDARFGSRILRGDYEGGASIDIVSKDSEFFLELARSLGASTPVMESAHDAYVDAVESGLGPKDYAALIIPLEAALGIRLSGGP